MNHDVLERAAATVRERWPDCVPAAGMILGSGWSSAAESLGVRDEIPFEEVGLGRPGVVGHAGRLARIASHGREALVFQGRRHFYEGEGWTPVALPVYVLRALGAPIVLLTNAAGGIREEIGPGELMIINDHINLIHGHPLIGPHDPFWGDRFPDQSAVYDAGLRDRLAAAAGRAGHPIHRGIYLAGSGPTYETPAEIRAYRALGADAVGMSTVPEAMLAHATGMRVVALSCITNYAAGIGAGTLSHDDVTRAARAAMPRMRAVLAAFWEDLAHAPAA